VDKAQLLAPRIQQATVDIPGVGAVTVRGLSRQELLDAGNLAEQGVAVMERAMLAAGMVDPALTVDEVAQWQQVSPANEIQPVVQRINELSGIGEDAVKAAFKSLPGQPGS
jgi:hypothetical protein